MLKGNARTFLNLPDGDFGGWLRIDSDVSGVVGDVTFSDPGQTFLSSVQLQDSPVRDVIFSHVADGQGYLTGLTFLNVSADPTTAELEVFNPQGLKTGEGTFVLQPFEHRPRLLSEIIPEFQPQIGGYIRITSNPSGVFTFELFLFVPTGKVLSLAAVPPQRGHGTILGKVAPVSVSGSFQLGTETSGFKASQAKGIRLDPSAEFVPGELIVKLHPESRHMSLSALARQYGLQLIRQGSDRLGLLSSGYLMGFSPLGTEAERQLQELKNRTLTMIEELNSDPGVLYAEPNYIYQTQAIPNDQHYSLQWHYPNINLPVAWDITKGDPNVVIAVIDTGAKFNHPDLEPRRLVGSSISSVIFKKPWTETEWIQTPMIPAMIHRD